MISKNKSFLKITPEDSLKLSFKESLGLLKELIEDIYPIDIALIIEKFSDEEILDMFSIIDNEYMSKILEESDEEYQKRIVNILALEDIIELFSYMSKDDITDIMGILKIGVRKQLMKLI